jgi:hypothetical protein
VRTAVLAVTLTLAVLAGACGDDSDTAVGDDGPGDTTRPDPTTTPDDTPPPDDSTPPDDTIVPNTEPPVDPGDILGAGPYPIADLTITVVLSPEAAGANYRVACLGDTATLTGDPAPASADTMCRALGEDAVRERIVLGDREGACTLQYGGPETATITGTFDGTGIDTAFHRADGCGISDWELLNRVLPLPG